ncbi:hypothetical protein AHAS_Ahas01G0160400 [Arachis hypogaea]
MTAVVPLEIRVFFEPKNKARVVEDYAKKVALTRDTRGGNKNRGQGERKRRLFYLWTTWTPCEGLPS